MKTLTKTLHCLLLLNFSLPALAQRETFDTTVTRKADALILEMQTAPSAGSSRRNGASHDGSRVSFEASVKSVSFDNIFFKFDSTDLRDEASRLQVEEIAVALRSPQLIGKRFLIEGHTCDLGEEDHNLKLSAKRAEAVRKLLIKRGVKKARLASLGFGESEIVDPVKRGDTLVRAEIKRMKSRRVVLREIKSSPK
jgi:outer membrane protein OmpA-like peptidoglycan-associated protein